MFDADIVHVLSLLFHFEDRINFLCDLLLTVSQQSIIYKANKNRSASKLNQRAEIFRVNKMSKNGSFKLSTGPFRSQETRLKGNFTVAKGKFPQSLENQRK